MPDGKYLRLSDQPQLFVFAAVPPTETQGQYGPRFDYAVNGDKILTVSKYLHDQIEAGRKNDKPFALRIRQYKLNGRTRYDVQEAAVSAAAMQPVQQQAARVERQQNRTFATLMEDMQYCLQAGHALCGENLPGATTEDVRTVATSLFIEANRSGIPIPRLNPDEIAVEGDGEEFLEAHPF